MQKLGNDPVVLQSEIKKGRGWSPENGSKPVRSQTQSVVHSAGTKQLRNLLKQMTNRLLYRCNQSASRNSRHTFSVPLSIAPLLVSS